MKSAEIQAVEYFLAKKPYFGDSKFGDKDAIVKLIGYQNRRYDKKLKCWGTTCLCEVHRLMASGTWWPRGIDRGWADIFYSLLSAAIVESTRAKQEASEQPPCPSPAAPQGPSRKERQKNEQERELGSVQSSEAELAQLKEMGAKAAMLHAATQWNELPGDLGSLGPRSGLSPAGRILRFVRLGRAKVRVMHALGSDLREAYQASDRLLIKKLNSLTAGFSIDSKKRPREATVETADFGDHLALPRAAECEDQCEHRAMRVPKSQQVPLPFPRGNCNVCCTEISIQFLECKCAQGWSVCKSCPGRIFHPTLQPCCHASQHV